MLNWKRATVYLIPIAVVGLLIVGTQSFRAPVPAEQYQECLYQNQIDRSKQEECKTDETLWQRTLSDPVAYYTLWLTIFTGALAGIGIIQGYMTNQQIRLAREEFIASHRPELVVTFFRTSEWGQTGKPRTVEIGIANKVTGKGWLVGSGAILRSYEPKSLPHPSSIEPGNVFNQRPFAVGNTDVGIVFRTGAPDGLGRKLYVSGWLAYRDAAEQTRTTYFCREYVAPDPILPGDDSGGYRKVSDPDFNAIY